MFFSKQIETKSCKNNPDAKCQRIAFELWDMLVDDSVRLPELNVQREFVHWIAPIENRHVNFVE